MKRLFSLAGAGIVCAVLLFFSCSKNESSNKQKAHIQVYLADDPGDFAAVYIDIQDIQINVNDDSSAGWQSLSNVATGSYNLLDLVNDQDTLLADAEIPSGKLHQIRLILGNDNHVELLNGQTIQLETPSAQQSGLKLNVQQVVEGGVLYTVLIDFDVAKSIIEAGNGKLILKPVIRTMLNPVGGSIQGVVTPDTVSTAILAIQGSDSIASTYTSATGNYLIKGLDAGVYSLHFLPGNAAFSDEVRDGINVTVGNVTLVDTVRLQ